MRALSSGSVCSPLPSQGPRTVLKWGHCILTTEITGMEGFIYRLRGGNLENQTSPELGRQRLPLMPGGFQAGYGNKAGSREHSLPELKPVPVLPRRPLRAFFCCPWAGLAYKQASAFAKLLPLLEPACPSSSLARRGLCSSGQATAAPYTAPLPAAASGVTPGEMRRTGRGSVTHNRSGRSSCSFCHGEVTARNISTFPAQQNLLASGFLRAGPEESW